MKNEWKKTEKELYLPKTIPSEINIPSFKFVAVSGAGNPNEEEFAGNIEKLYSVAYTVKMMPKSGFVPLGYADYVGIPFGGTLESS